jgi:hypothetical protein
MVFLLIALVVCFFLLIVFLRGESLLDLLTPEPQQATSRSVEPIYQVSRPIPGEKPPIVLFPSELNFAPRAAGTESQPQVLSVYNNAGVNLSIQTVPDGEGAAAFLLDSGNCTASLLAPGQSCQISVRYRPQSGGRHPARLLVYGGPYATAGQLFGFASPASAPIFSVAGGANTVNAAINAAKCE